MKEISIHALLAESDCTFGDKAHIAIRFLSTRSLRRATHSTCPGLFVGDYFYPRSPCGERRCGGSRQAGCRNFYPRSPCGERRASCLHRFKDVYISIHALLAESDVIFTDILWPPFISIHALLAESDDGIRANSACPGISIHALLAESDQPPRQKRDCPRISIHALLAESDRARAAEGASARNFYPRSPCGERLVFLCPFLGGYDISIHALLAESDQGRGERPHCAGYFYPRSPCGERPALDLLLDKPQKFLSTLSLRRATWPR